MNGQTKMVVYITLLMVMLALIKEGDCLNYEYGKTYKYTYDTEVLFNDKLSQKATKPQKDVGLRLTLEFNLSPVFATSGTQLIKLQVTSAILTTNHRNGLEGRLQDVIKFPIYFEYENGVVGQVYAVENDSIFCTNIKKGIVAMFQLQTEAGERDELDVSGECSTTYKISGPTIIKQKNRCQNIEIAGQHVNENQVFGVSSSSSSTFTYQLENDIVKTMMGSDEHAASLNMKTTLNTMVITVQRLTFLSSEPVQESDLIPGRDLEDVVDSLKQGSNYPIVDMLLPSAPESQHCTPTTCIKPMDLLQAVYENLTPEKMATIEAASSFLALVKSFRKTGKGSIEEVMTSQLSAGIVPQLLDIGVATQTPGAHQAMMTLLQFEETTNLEYPLRYLLAAAFTTHPGEYLIKDLLGILKKNVPSSQVKEGVALALGAIVNKYCQSQETCEDQVVADYRNYMLETLSKCKDEQCKLVRLQSMGNSGDIKFLKVILESLETPNNSAMFGFTAAQALRRMNITEDADIKRLQKIYHQTNRNYDSSVCAVVAEVLLNNKPTEEMVSSLFLAAIGDQTQFELSTFILRKIVDMVKYNDNLKNAVDNIIKDSQINNYNLWAQKGKSSAFSSLLAETQDTNATYGLYMEIAKTGVLKKSAMDVNLVAKNSLQKLLSFGIYAAGLESIIGEAEEEGEEPTAGLGLKILDVLLPPVEFFSGSSGLMSAVWNAPSDPVSALQVNLLLQDHSEKIHLANGLVVDLQVLGGVSIDLTGMVSISLWNRNSESLIRNSGAVVIESSMRLDSEIGKSGIVVIGEGEAYIDFETYVDFYQTPFKMCMQMKRPKLKFRQNIHKYESGAQFKKSYTSKVSTVSHIEGLSYFLSEKNSNECKELESR